MILADTLVAQWVTEKKVLHGLPGILPSGIRGGSGTGANFKRTIWLFFFTAENTENTEIKRGHFLISSAAKWCDPASSTVRAFRECALPGIRKTSLQTKSSERRSPAAELSETGQHRA